VTDIAPPISVIICAYSLERWNELVAAVESVEHQSTPAAEVIVVIDHNGDLLDRAEAELRRVTVLPNREAQGLSGARNTGIAAANGDVLAFMDDDAVADENWLQRLLPPFNDADVLGVGGMIRPQWQSGMPSWFPPEFAWVVGCSYIGLPDVRSPIRNLIGCNMAIRRSVFDTVGGFVSGIGRIGKVPVGCEETELCIRARQASPGGEFVYEPDAIVHHNVPAGRATWAYFRSRCLAEGRSKAQVTAAVGVADGLDSERRYATRTLPIGVARNLGQGLGGRDTKAVARAAAIVAGLAFTSVGYTRARLGVRGGAAPPGTRVAALGASDGVSA
jgi:GT2 family glycosyltransferase